MQIDTAQQRAGAIKLANALLLPWQEEPKDLEIIQAALQQARREALQEVVTLHQEWMAGKHSGTFSDALDRLREGVE